MLKLLSSKKNRYKRLLGLFLFLTLILIYSPAFAGYKIYLKNGNVITAEDIKEVGNELKIYYSAGEITLDRGEVEKIVETSGRGDVFSSEVPSGEKSEKPKQEEIKSGEQNREDIKDRLLEISKRKEEMMVEKERLDSEQRQFNEDLKKEGRLTSIRKNREFERRAAELEEKIKKFNEELERLNQEEERLLNILK